MQAQIQEQSVMMQQLQEQLIKQEAAIAQLTEEVAAGKGQKSDRGNDDIHDSMPSAKRHAKCGEAIRLDSGSKDDVVITSHPILMCPHGCSDYTAPTKKALTSHLRRKHTGKIFNCEILGCNYQTRDKEHIQRHTDDTVHANV